VGRRRYGSRSFPLTAERYAEAQVNVLIAIVPVLVTIFAIGAELGVIGVLSITLSDATGFGRFVAFDLIAAVALFVLYYIFREFREGTSAR
jgi:ABC-type nickel/cobalt efflux system permease component RcnA